MTGLNYRSMRDLTTAVLAWKPALQADTDLVVGVPRSGLLVANLLALQLGVPMTDVDGLVARRLLNNGHRSVRKVDLAGSAAVRVLVVDDMVETGATLERVRAAVAAAGLPHAVRYASVYVAPGAEDRVDLYHEVLPTPRALQWNVMQAPGLARCCVDIDGVLCADPTDRENDDGERYRAFLRDAGPRVRTPVTVGWLVTNRLERYRSETEDWLARHGIRHGGLYMRDLPDAAARRESGEYGRHKAETYAATGADLFIESDAWQAAEIAALSGRPVFCTDTRRLVAPGDPPPARPGRIARRVTRLLRLPA